MFDSELRSEGLEEAVERLATWNAARMPLIRKAASTARRTMRQGARARFEASVEERRRTNLKRAVSGRITVFPDRLILAIGTTSRLLAYHERGEHGTAERRPHIRKGRVVRRHPLKLNIPAIYMIRDAVQAGARPMVEGIAHALEAAARGRGGGGA